MEIISVDALVGGMAMTRLALLLGCLLLMPGVGAEELEFSDGDITDCTQDPDSCAPVMLPNFTWALSPPSPCVQLAQKLLQESPDGYFFAQRQASALRAIALLLLDRRLGADCTVAP